MDNSQPQVYH